MPQEETITKTHVFTYVECPCGHRGAVFESVEAGDAPHRRYQVWRRQLTRAGTYEGEDGLFAYMKPGCPARGRSLSPDDVVSRSELRGTDEVLHPLERPLGAGC